MTESRKLCPSAFLRKGGGQLSAIYTVSNNNVMSFMSCEYLLIGIALPFNGTNTKISPSLDMFVKMSINWIKRLIEYLRLCSCSPDAMQMKLS